MTIPPSDARQPDPAPEPRLAPRIIRARYRPDPAARALIEGAQIEGAQIHQGNATLAIPAYVIDESAYPGVRYRSQTGLRWLDIRAPAAALFSADEARQDRVTVTASTLFACPDQAAYERVMSYWGDQSVEPLLQCSAMRGRHGFKLRVNSGWLISGKGSTVINAHGRGQVSLTLSTNVTRFLRHQGTADLEAIRALPATVALRTRRDSEPRGLDGNDNVLVDRTQLGGTAFANRAAYWGGVVATFLDHVRALLTENLAPQSRGGRVLDEDLPGWTDLTLALGEVETYWELSTPNAPATMMLLKIALERSSPDIECVLYGTRAEGGMPCVSIDLTKEVRFKVYAKRLDRLRFEITHTGHISQTADRAGSGDNIFRGLQVDAAERMVKVWTVITTMLTDEREAGQIADFFARLRQVGFGGTDADPVITLMQVNRHLTENAVSRPLLRGSRAGRRSQRSDQCSTWRAQGLSSGSALVFVVRHHERARHRHGLKRVPRSVVKTGVKIGPGPMKTFHGFQGAAQSGASPSKTAIAALASAPQKEKSPPAALSREKFSQSKTLIADCKAETLASVAVSAVNLYPIVAILLR